MGGCKSKTKGTTTNNPNKLTLAIVGLDNAGKTVTTKGLQGESLDSVAPTVGFSSVDFRFEKHDITMFDLGGGKRIRDIWKKYFSEIFGLIYVIDSSEPDRMDECHSVLSGLLEHPKISGKPVLILANKQDKPGAMDEIDVCEYLRLEELVNRNKCPCRVETCSAILGQGKKLDKSITQGMNWLMTVIQSNLEKYKERVDRDTQDQRGQEEQEKKERAERVAKIREERKRKEEEEAAARGEVRKDSDEEDFMDGDPYKPLDYEELKKKEEQLKQEKKKQKALKNHKIISDDDSAEENTVGRPRRKKVEDSDDDEEVPSQTAIRSNRTYLGYDSDNDRLRLRKSGSLEPLGHSPVMPRRTLDLESASPSLQKTRGFSSKGYGSDKENSDEGISSNNLQKSAPWLRNRSPRPLESSLGLPPVRKYGEENGEGDSKLYAPRRGLAPLTPLAPLEPLDAGGKKNKKKKPKKNQTMPSLDGDDDYDPTPKSFYGSALDPLPQRSGTPPQSRSLLKASRSPRLATLEEPEEQESEFKSKWGLVDDLPDVAPSYSRKSRPNVDSDDDIIT